MILALGIFITLYLFANIRFFKIEIDKDKVYLPKDKIKFGEDNNNFYYYKSNITDLGDELETPYFVFNKNNVKEVKAVNDKNLVKDAKEHFPEMFYASREDRYLCIEFKEPLTFEEYDDIESLKIDESIKKIERIYVSLKKSKEFIKEFGLKK